MLLQFFPLDLSCTHTIIISIFQFELSFDPKTATADRMGGLLLKRPIVSHAIKTDVASICNCIKFNIESYNEDNEQAVPKRKQDVDNSTRQAVMEAALAKLYCDDDKNKVKQEAVAIRLPLDPKSEFLYVISK